MFNIKIGVHDPFPYKRQSPYLSSLKDNEEGNRSNLIFDKVRMFEGVEVDNALNRWRHANAEVAKLKDHIGLPVVGFAGVRRCPRDQAEWACQSFDTMVKSMEPLAQDCLNQLPHWKGNILSSFSGERYLEVQKVLDQFNPKLEDMLPTRAVDDLTDGTGLVAESALAQAIVKTRLETELSIINTMDEMIVEMLEKLAKIERVKGQGEDMEAILNLIGPMITEFSSKPDVVERWDRAEKALKAIPRPEKGQSDLFPEIIDKAKDALSIFTSPTPIEEWSAQDEEALNDHIADLHASFETDTGDTVIETEVEPTITELMEKKYSTTTYEDDDVF